MQWTDRIGRRVKLRDLHIFLAVAQSGSMTKAADELAVSPPVVSKTISDLERSLGVRLLDRTYQGVELTPYGIAFAASGRAVFDEMRRGVQQIEFLADPTSGELRVGCTTPLADGFIPSALEILTRRYPRISCHATDGDSPTLCQLLRNRKIDLAVSRSWGTYFGEEFTAEFLFDESMFVVAGIGNPLCRRRRIKFIDLLDQPWVLPESDNMVGVLINTGFQRAGIALPTPRVVSGSMGVRARLVESGRYLSLMPGSMLYFGTHRLKLKVLPVALPLEPQPVEVITLKDRTPNPIAKLFIDELRKLVTPMTSEDATVAHFCGDGSKARLL